ncbi:MAG: DUF4301 family protein [Bacteroidota bacterium]
MFNQDDLKQISIKGIELQVISRQIDHFIKGFPFISLDRPAIPGDGLLNFNEDEKNLYISHFEKKLPGLKVVKFVPASGAASRMFKHLFEFSEKNRTGVAGGDMSQQASNPGSVAYLMKNLSKTAFYSDLSVCFARNGVSLDQLIENNDFTPVIDAILGAGGLDYANLPKALLKFHQYSGSSRTSAEEHLVEAAEYARDISNKARIHFTISPEHREKFEALFSEVREGYESELGVEFEISFSVQKPSTDTIAVDEGNQPFRNTDGSLLFRPGGHGALLGNLNEVDADLIFVKNIDNIVPDRLKDVTFQYKKLLGGCLLLLKEAVSGFLERLETGQATKEELQTIIAFAKEKLFLDIPGKLQSMTETAQTQMLFSLLDKPIRVCGMVKNEGEPGGGPFWVRGDDGLVSLQVVEASQIDANDSVQRSILASSTHFNPVDLVCSTKDYKGNTFNLNDFVDQDTGFISLKSSGGKTLKAQELPGLWNGAMAKWITIFAEVPIITFNPVKTVNDLLRREHIAI